MSNEAVRAILKSPKRMCAGRPRPPGDGLDEVGPHQLVGLEGRIEGHERAMMISEPDPTEVIPTTTPPNTPSRMVGSLRTVTRGRSVGRGGSFRPASGHV